MTYWPSGRIRGPGVVRRCVTTILPICRACIMWRKAAEASSSAKAVTGSAGRAPSAKSAMRRENSFPIRSGCRSEASPRSTMW